MSTQEQSGYQMFPVLDAARVETALRFASGPERRRGYRFKGRALILPPDDGDSLMSANLVRARMARRILSNTLSKSKPLLSSHCCLQPISLPTPPRSQDEIRSTYYQRYGVKPLGT